jgi:hypothetical protein
MPAPVSGRPFTVDALVTNPLYVPTPTGSVAFDFGDGTPVVTVPLDYRLASTTHTYSAVGLAKVTATYSGDSTFAVTSATLQGQIVRSTPGALLNVFGDSISQAGNGVYPDGANWVTMTAWVEGVSLNDMALPGYKTADEVPFIYNTKIAPDSYSAVLLGQNDFSSNSGSVIAQYQSSLLAGAVWLLIPDTDANGRHPKLAAQDPSVAKSGAWSQSALYPSIGLGTTEANDSLTATIEGSTIYLGLSGTTASNYAVDVYADGALLGEYSPAIVYTGNTTTNIPWGVRIPIPGSALTASHIVTAVCKTPGTSGCFVDWLAGNGFVEPNKLPLLWLGEPYHTNQNSDPSTVAAFVASIRQFGQNLQADGLGITLADVFDNFDGHLEPWCLVDQVHPAKCGEQVISATFLGAMNWLFTKDQRIDFDAQSSANFSSNPIPVGVSATSDLPVTLTVVSGNATIENNSLNAFSAGSITLEANQAGDWNFRPAAPELATIQILPAPVTVAVQPLSTQVIVPGSTSVTVLVTWAGNPPVTGSVTLYDGSTAIGTAQLNGAGEATFANMQFSLGTHPLTAQYAQQGNFAAGVSAAVAVEVVKGAPSISWANPAAISYGTALGANQLNATSPVAGTFTYTPAAGTVLSAGSHSISVTFTPTDLANYSVASSSVTLMVNKVTPTITWNTPAVITYGMLLSATQLNATASVPGTFVYSPAAGEMPPIGNNTLSASFTPTDSNDYASAAASVILTVNSPLNPIPVLNGISPAIANAGGAAFQLTIAGTGFISGSTVFWGATALPTQYVSGSQLTAQVPASVIAISGITAVTVQSPTPGGGTSPSLQFEVDSASGNAPSFSTAAGIVTAGGTASYPVTLPSSATNVSVTCLNLPSGATCSYSSVTGIVSIATASTTPKGTYDVTVVFTETLPGTAIAFVLLPVLLIPLLLIRKRLTAQGAWFSLCFSIVLLAGGTVVVGCGSKASPPKSTVPDPTHQVTSSGSVRLIVQ